MKKLLILVFICMNIYSENIVHTINSKSTRSITRNRSVQFDGEGFEMLTGMPGLPIQTAKFVIPTNVDFSTLDISFERGTENVTNNVNISPVPPEINLDDNSKIWPDGVNPITGKNEVVYSTNALYPEEDVKIVSVDKLWEYNIITVNYYPARYNPVTRTLVESDLVNVNISMDQLPGNPGIVPNAAPAFIKRMQKKLEAIVLNNESEWIENTNSLYENSSYSSPNEMYVILTTNKVREYNGASLMELALLKRNQGYNVIIVDEDDYNNGQTVSDNIAGATIIRNWLRENYASMNISNVLLIGDPRANDNVWINGVPHNFGEGSSYDEFNLPMVLTAPLLDVLENTDPDDNQYAIKSCFSDYYYAELSSPTWDVDGDRNVGEFTDDCLNAQGVGVDLIAEVAVGRYATYYYDPNIANDASQRFDDYVDKIVAYSNESDISWRQNGLLINPYMLFGGGSYEPTYMGCEEILYGTLRPEGYDYHRIYDYTDNNYIIPETFGSSFETTRDVWNSQSFGYVNWLSHGSVVISNGKFQSYLIGTTADDVIDLNNIRMVNSSSPSIVFMGSCLLGAPDAEKGLPMENLHNGGIVSIAGTEIMYGWPENHAFQNYGGLPGIAYAFGEELIKEGKSAGQSLNDLRTRIEIGPRPHFYTNYLAITTFGDPSISINEKLYQSTLLYENFENGMNGWETYVDWNAQASFAIVEETPGNHALNGYVSNCGNESWHVHIRKTGIPIVAGETYRVKFKARTENIGKIKTFKVRVEEDGGDYTGYGEKIFTANGDLNNYSFVFTAQETDYDAVICFELGEFGDADPLDLVIDEVEIRK